MSRKLHWSDERLASWMHPNGQNASMPPLNTLARSTGIARMNSMSSQGTDVG